MDTLSSRMIDRARRAPGHPAIAEPESTLSAAALAAATGRLAGALRDMGVGRGDRVALAFANGSAFVTSFFAAAHLGAVLVPLNPAFTEGDMASVLRDGGARLILSSKPLADRARAAAAIVGLDSEAVVIVEPPAPLAPSGDPGADWPASLARPTDPVLCLYSSGSTGRPKRIERSHGQIVWEVERLAEAIALSPDDRVLGATPFSHTNGLMRSMVASIVTGATLLPVAQFERRAVGRLIQERAITVFIGVPFMFAMLGETRWPAPVDFSSLRLCLSSSAPLKLDTARRFRERYGIAVRQLYGTTETGTIALDLGTGPEESGCLGRPLPGVEVEVFSERGDPLPAGEAGEVGIRTPAATAAYVGQPEQTAASFRDGFFLPGDIARKDPEGRIHLIGRKSLFINRGGFKVNPFEIEELLERHPNVREAAVVGVDTEYGDQRIKAVLVLAEPCDEADIIDFCRGHVADFKVPSVVEFRAELPKSSAGKLLRKALVGSPGTELEFAL